MDYRGFLAGLYSEVCLARDPEASPDSEARARKKSVRTRKPMQETGLQPSRAIKIINVKTDNGEVGLELRTTRVKRLGFNHYTNTAYLILVRQCIYCSFLESKICLFVPKERTNEKSKIIII